MWLWSSCGHSKDCFGIYHLIARPLPNNTSYRRSTLAFSTAQCPVGPVIPLKLARVPVSAFQNGTRCWERVSRLSWRLTRRTVCVTADGLYDGREVICVMKGGRYCSTNDPRACSERT